MTGNGIGELSESSLHNALKHYYSGPEDELEAQIDGYVIDVRKPQELIEIQTSSFSSVKKKYSRLLKNHKIRMVYPIARKKIIVKTYKSGKVERRKSPKSGSLFDLFSELVYIPHLMKHPNLSLDIVFIEEEEFRLNDDKGSWRRKGWSIVDHQLTNVINIVSFNSLDDFKKLLPTKLPSEFTTAMLSKYLKIPKYLSQKIVYSYEKMGIIAKIGKDGRYNLYQLN